MTVAFDTLLQQIDSLEPLRLYGTVVGLQGLLVTVDFKADGMALGSRCAIETTGKESILAEVVGFKDSLLLLMPFGVLTGVSPGARVFLVGGQACVYPHPAWKGRVLNAFAIPIDDMGLLIKGDKPYPLQALPLPSARRDKVEEPLDVGVRAINTFLTICKGQRMGIFAGSGVGKSVLMGMLVRYTSADICVVGLIGERGREVKEFIENTLGEEGLKKTILVVATSDEPALMRREAAYLALTIAEFFRDQGLSVLCVLDSVTRFAMAQREIGLSAGEPPTTKGYTPTVFAELPKLLERAGPGIQQSGQSTGTITGIFTVLVDGDDHNEPIADAARGILDGHIVLDRAIAERGHFPAINILKSVSRMVPACHTSQQNAIVKHLKRQLASYEDMADMIRLGAYKPGTSAEVDAAIHVYPALMEFLAQSVEEHTTIANAFEALSAVTPYHQK